MNHKLAKGMKIWKGIKNTTTLLFSRKDLKFHTKKEANKWTPIVMEHFNSIPFNKSGPANKQHTYQSINQSILAYVICISALHIQNIHQRNHNNIEWISYIVCN